jgi:hypothetical protein
MSDQVLEQLHTWRAERASDALTPLDLDTILVRGRRRRRVRQSLSVALPTVLAVVLLATTFGVINARTSTQKVRPAEPPRVHSTVIEVPPGERVPASPGFEARLTESGRFCFYRTTDPTIGCMQTTWSTSPLSVVRSSAGEGDPNPQLVIYGLYQGAGARDVIVQEPDGEHAATVVSLKGNSDVVAYYLPIPQTGNLYPTVRVFDGQGQLLDEVSLKHVLPKWDPPTAQEMHNRCQLQPTVPVVGNHPIGCYPRTNPLP